DRMWLLFDPRSTPEALLPWLAAWIDLEIDRKWSPEKTREMIRSAHADYDRRGTVDGLVKSIADYAGVPASILERYKLRHWLTLGGKGGVRDHANLYSLDFARRLQVGHYSQLGSFRLRGDPAPPSDPYAWGAHKFTVYFVTHPYQVDDVKQDVARVV